VLAVQERSTLCDTGAVPLPVSDCDVGAFEALLENVIVPDAVPLAAGVKVTVNEAVPPAAIVTGNVMPVTLNSGLSELTPATCTDDPVALNVPVFDALDPTVMFPKLWLAGDAANWPGAVPVPDSATVSDGFEASDITVRFPLTLPAAVGENTTEKVTLCPAARVVGKESPLIENAAALELALVMITPDPPLLVTVSDFVLLFPT
jgi:hypothetical protein